MYNVKSNKLFHKLIVLTVLAAGMKNSVQTVEALAAVYKLKALQSILGCFLCSLKSHCYTYPDRSWWKQLDCWRQITSSGDNQVLNGFASTKSF